MGISREDAQRVYQNRNPRNGNYYMLNIGHPVIFALWVKWRTEHGISGKYPAGDADRIAFEMSLLAPETQEKVMEHTRKREEAEAENGRDIRSV